MRLTTLPLALFAALTTLTTGAPTTSGDLTSLNFPAANLTAMLSARGASPQDFCPAGENSCGVVLFKSGTYVSFGQGTCMQLSGNIESIYVAKCYCSLWNTCTGHSSGSDVFAGGMTMCEKPKKPEEFDVEPKFISCGGMGPQ
ncbi:hypothetical protein E8E13_010136 [Curvularia kusanoi]|uniref:Uncharacterized protein n=1 Tax=Curvularia kusanoi TaxID=90978 RepID=A0A9P4TLE4_CURKU|nr:hypothetical protein E8E13_010136 [Curvularia kusanoi]